jgi:hypothetical protein
MRRISTVPLLALAAVLAMAAVAWAGDMNKSSSPQSTAQQMASMKEAMSKCAVCKPLVPHLDAIGPISMDVVKLDNGVAISHSVAPASVAEFHKAWMEVGQAGAASMNLTDEQAKVQLCEMCQGIRSAVKAGAMMSNGETKRGEMMVLASANPTVQGQIAALGDKCAMMAGMQQAAR